MVPSLRQPPTAFVCFAISPTPRVGVPLKYMCSSTCAMPTMSSVSSKYPAETNVTIATTGAERSRRTRTVRPFDNLDGMTEAGSMENESGAMDTMDGAFVDDRVKGNHSGGDRARPNRFADGYS